MIMFVHEFDYYVIDGDETSSTLSSGPLAAPPLLLGELVNIMLITIKRLVPVVPIVVV